MNWFSKNWFSKKLSKQKEVTMDDEVNKDIETLRDNKITELAYCLSANGIDYIVPVIYEWNLENYEFIIGFKDIWSRQDWISLCQLNELYSPQDRKVDNESLKEHDLEVQLPTKQEIMKYRIGIDDGESDNG